MAAEGGAVEILGVVGAGQMGSGIAQLAAQTGVHVRLIDAERAWAERGLARIDGQLEKLEQKGKLGPGERAQIMKRITVGDGDAALEPCDAVIEAATEDQALKKKIFADLDRAVKPRPILAPNTSSISITPFASPTPPPHTAS